MVQSLQDHQHQQVIMCPVLNWICEWNNRTGSATAYSVASRKLRIRCQQVTLVLASAGLFFGQHPQQRDRETLRI